MELTEFAKVLKRKVGTILTLTFVILILTLGISLLNPLKYEAKSRLLVVQNTMGNDPYTISKSNEYLGNLFSQVVYSGSFYNLVIESSQYNIDKGYFSGSYNDQIRAWQKTVSTKTLSDTGIIEISVFHPNPYQAQQIALAINDILMNKNSNYQGNGQGIKVNIIDQPLVSTYPVKPNLPQNLLVALAGGLLLAVFYAYLFPEERYDLKLWRRHRLKRTKGIGHSIKLDYYPLNEQKNDADITNSQDFRPRGNMDNIFKN